MVFEAAAGSARGSTPPRHLSVLVAKHERSLSLRLTGSTVHLRSDGVLEDLESDGDDKGVVKEGDDAVDEYEASGRDGLEGCV